MTPTPAPPAWAHNALLLKRLRLPALAPAATTMQKEPEHA